jgi:hypothetical protein
VIREERGTRAEVVRNPDHARQLPNGGQ